MAVERRVKLTVDSKLLTKKGAFRKRVARVLAVAVRLGLENIRSELVRQVPKDTGTGANSLRVVGVRVEGTSVTGSIAALPYVSFQGSGFGGKGKWPPGDPIEAWVRRKGVHRKLKGKPWMARLLPKAMRDSKSKRDRQRKGKFVDAEKVFLMAYFVRRKIAKRGVKGRNFIEPALEKKIPEVLRLMENQLQELSA